MFRSKLGPNFTMQLDEILVERKQHFVSWARIILICLVGWKGCIIIAESTLRLLARPLNDYHKIFNLSLHKSAPCSEQLQMKLAGRESHPCVGVQVRIL